MASSTISCLVHRDKDAFSKAVQGIIKFIKFPCPFWAWGAKSLERAVCTCNKQDINRPQRTSLSNLKLYCFYEAPTDVYLIDRLRTKNYLCDKATLKKTCNFIFKVFDDVRREEEGFESAIRFICILKMALSGRYDLLEECKTKKKLKLCYYTLMLDSPYSKISSLQIDKFAILGCEESETENHSKLHCMDINSSYKIAGDINCLNENVEVEKEKVTSNFLDNHEVDWPSFNKYNVLHKIIDHSIPHHDGVLPEQEKTRKLTRNTIVSQRIVLEFHNARCLRKWNLHLGSRSLEGKYRPCSIFEVNHFNFNIFRNGQLVRRSSPGNFRNGQLVEITCRRKHMPIVVRELEARAREYRPLNTGPPERNYKSFEHGTLEQQASVKDNSRVTYDENAFMKKKCRKRATNTNILKKEMPEKEKRFIIKCFNCKAMTDKIDHESTSCCCTSDSKWNNCVDLLKCRHHPGYIKLDQTWSCCGFNANENGDFYDEVTARYANEWRGLHDKNGCCYSPHDWRYIFQKKRSKTLNSRVQRRQKESFHELYNHR